jgi:hypothetical protein
MPGKTLRSCSRVRTLLLMVTVSCVCLVESAGAFGWSNFSAVLVTRYLCAPCGFGEEWVHEKAGLEKLTAKDNR